MSNATDELLGLLNETMSAFVITRRRYRLVTATLAEIGRVERQVEARAPERRVHPGNDAVFQMLRDSFDMLVIDLASIREEMVARTGLLCRLKNEFTGRLRRWAPEDIQPRKVVVFGDGDHSRHEVIAAEHDAYERKRIAENANRVLDRMFSGEYPVSPDAVEKLIKRFMKDTKAIHEDRNAVRAHRYEYRPGDRSRRYCPPDEVGKHIETMARYLVDLYLVLTLGDYHAEMDFESSAKHVAKDLADIIVHGSINDAVIACGMAERTEANPTPWYWAYRKRYMGEDENSP